MEAGRTEIINQALLFCNQDTILNSDGKSKNEKLCDAFYDPSLEEALSGHPWSFATVAARLQQLAQTPRDIRFKYAYQLPENFGRMLQIINQGNIQFNNNIAPIVPQELLEYDTNSFANSIHIPEYTVQGKEVYSDYKDLQIIYMRTDVRPKEMTPQFRNYFASYLAAKLFSKITGGSEGYKELQQKVMLFRNEAKNTDSEQMDTLPPNRPNLLVAARMY